jgi:hypothetical protein
MYAKAEVSPDSHEKARRRIEREVSVIDDRTVLERLRCKLAILDSAGMYAMIRGSKASTSSAVESHIHMCICAMQPRSTVMDASCNHCPLRCTHLTSGA